MTDLDLFFEMYGSPKELERQFKEEAKNWTFHPVIRDNKTIAFFITKENKIHCACLYEYKNRWFPYKMFKKLIKNILKEYGKVTTSTLEETRDFVERLGFIEIGKDGMTINYEKYEV